MTTHGQAPGWRAPRRVILALVVAGFVVTWVAVGALLAPIHEMYDPSIPPDVGHETVVAALERGLAPVHPLILDAAVEPGEVSAPDHGHRATVTFTMLGVPGPTRVRLVYDISAHWGGVPDRGAPELALWAVLLPLALLGIILVGWVVVRRRVRVAATRGPGATA